MLANETGVAKRGAATVAGAVAEAGAKYNAASSSGAGDALVSGRVVAGTMAALESASHLALSASESAFHCSPRRCSLSPVRKPDASNGRRSLQNM
eukprot:scaffold132305_cov63-Phaeocystis_antarctica.AAC.1